MTGNKRISARMASAAVGAAIAVVGSAAGAEAVTYYRSPLYSGYKSCEVARTSPTYNNSHVRASGRCLAYEHPVTREFTGYRFIYASR